jgi:ABC-type Fe3+-siderophore transport system permease subunit
MIVVVVAMGVVAGMAVTLAVLLLRWHAALAVCGALLSALGVTALVVYEATKVDGIPPTRYDRIVIAIGAGFGALIPALVLTFARWANRPVNQASQRLAAGSDVPGGDPLHE